jgi:ribonuclease Z
MLLMGHFSTRYKNLENFKIEASEIFQNSHTAEQGQKYNF